MKVAAYRFAGERHVGQVLAGDRQIAPFALTLQEAQEGVASLIGRRTADLETLSPVDIADVEIEAPFPRPARNIFCVGKNYRAHAKEFTDSGFDSSAAQGEVPPFPIVFSKVPECVVASDAAVVIDPAVSAAIDYEAELAVIIGAGGRGIRAADAMQHVWGYTIINDVTARDLQGRYSQWLLGKSQDTFCPMGPFAVTADEIDIGDTTVQCYVNGELRQDANTCDLIFDIPTLIETISAGVTLQPGDIIATGTPAGVGIGFKPPKYLRDGDVVRIDISGIGSLENRFVERRS
ncbi:fumarylacetoacetate hydrolase family protein [Pseudohoeflea coraliihabitans]|uniref:Fumarylacetoacetate hydrolase family protein n=1 Tax=Pseudohoeflea coraliihabitans TaxID=2860393 RepID=A0ABS6WPI5_9HYPH|nr:fumarylacetoacetate hydrolase family protein [Pseudohoeflea sp. DP4N28-3]MBW3097548.1 fumarylacetoacetate hydrolase family protein [Pseudohoeflea sp. DP4N28-3]